MLTARLILQSSTIVVLLRNIIIYDRYVISHYYSLFFRLAWRSPARWCKHQIAPLLFLIIYSTILVTISKCLIRDHYKLRELQARPDLYLALRQRGNSVDLLRQICGHSADALLEGGGIKVGLCRRA